MRSAVSVILSTPATDPNMSRPDYEQTIHDHSALLILIRHSGDVLSTKCFNQIFERMARVNCVKITDKDGEERTIWMRYVKEYPVGNNDWGDFQTYRRLLGLITIGKCKNESEFNEICRLHESLKVKYQSTLYDSRCFLIGANAGEETLRVELPIHFKSTPVYYASETALADLEAHMMEFSSALFWILESKRLERSKEKVEKATFLMAPFEKRDFVGINMESRENRKRCIGRLTKNLGDLSLQAGLVQQALNFYYSALETLCACKDWLWIGSTAEGLCAASSVYLFPRYTSSSPLHRNASLPEGSVKKRYNPPTEGSLSLERKKEAHNYPPNMLNKESVYKYYWDAVVHYSKYNNAAVVEMEASFKAAKISIRYNDALQAHKFLQNVLFINFVLSEEEKIQRLMTFSELYKNVGFRRKSCFFKRLTATRYVSARNPNTNWEQCYNLMLQSLSGYNLSLDPNDGLGGEGEGWPRLQCQVLQDLVVAATRLSNPGLATRHMTYLLQTMWHHMSPEAQQEAALQLKLLTTQCEGSPVPLVLDSGLIVPPANLLNIPQPLNFAVQNLKTPLRPHKIEAAKEDYGPFLFTPLNLDRSADKNKRQKKRNKLEFSWVAEESCEILLEISNPLPFDLEVSNILLLTSGVVFESIPTTVTLPGHCAGESVLLKGIPKECGELEITGYSTHALGVKSNCKLRRIKNISPPCSVIKLDVIPPLPVLQILPEWLTDDDGDDDGNQHRTTLSLYAGESLERILKFKNAGREAVELLELCVETSPDANSRQSRLVTYREEILREMLPLKRGEEVAFPLTLFGYSNFLAQPNVVYEGSGSVKSSLFSGPGSFPSVPSRKSSSAAALLYERSAPVSASTFSFRSAGSSLNSYNSSQLKITPDTSRVVECRVKAKYSGGPGLKEGFCRVASYVLYAEICNSVLITNWDVLPAETSSQFYLVLDIANMTNHEVELNYTKSKIILIEEGETCRVPIPIDRCPVYNFERLFEAGNYGKDDLEMNKVCSEHIAAQVDLRWKINPDGREGKALLHGLTLSPAMLDLVRISPISWEISTNGELLKNSESFAYEVGKVLSLGIRVWNRLSWPLANISLHMSFYQDYQNGVFNYHLDTCLGVIGCPDVNLPEISEKGSFYHECNVVFFNAGLYKLNIMCCSLEKSVWKLIPSIEIKVTD